MQPSRGFTLIELLTVLLLVALISCAATWRHNTCDYNLRLLALEIADFIETAVLLSRFKNESLTLCRSIDYKHCAVDWQGDLLLLDTEKHLLLVFTLPKNILLSKKPPTPLVLTAGPEPSHSFSRMQLRYQKSHCQRPAHFWRITINSLFRVRVTRA